MNGDLAANNLEQVFSFDTRSPRQEVGNGTWLIYGGIMARSHHRHRRRGRQRSLWGEEEDVVLRLPLLSRLRPGHGMTGYRACWEFPHLAFL